MKRHARVARQVAKHEAKPRNTTVLSFRLPSEIIGRVDAYADSETRSRVNMVEVLLKEALAARDEGERK
jgi:hypothetical protein